MPKTLAIRLDDDLHGAAAAVAQLQGISLTELIRSAIETYLETTRANGDLASQAEAALAEIDSEADARRKAIQGLLAPNGADTPPPAKASTSRARKATPEAS